MEAGHPRQQWRAAVQGGDRVDHEGFDNGVNIEIAIPANELAALWFQHCVQSLFPVGSESRPVCDRARLKMATYSGYGLHASFSTRSGSGDRKRAWP